MPSASSVSKAPPAPPKRLSDWETIAKLPQVRLSDGERPASLGHGGGRFTYTIQAPEAVHSSYLSPVRDTRFPPGSVLLERTFDSKSGDPGSLFVMLKQEAGWEFHELDGDGYIQPSDEERCRRCHSEARADSVFGAPSLR